MASNQSLIARVMLDEAAKLINTLDLFRPTETQEPFFRTMARDGILEVGIGGGNRAGKSLCVAVWFAAVVLNRPVTMRNGDKIYMRPERWRNEAMDIWLVGLNWDHIGKTIYRLLFGRSGIRLIQDVETRKWRAYDPTLPGDLERFGQTRMAPPLIRPADIKGGRKGMSWENRKEYQFKSFQTLDGTLVRAFASTGERPQGDPCHVIWVDERLDDESWHSELMSRLMDYQGRLLWTSWPESIPSANFGEMVDRATKQAGTEDQSAFYFEFKGGDNPYTRSKHREHILNTMDEDTRRARDEGFANIDKWRIYPRFSPFVHRALPADPIQDDKLATAIRAINGIPGDWTRYRILDPGTVNPAVLWVAVPPPSFGDFIVPYDELYVHNVNAKQLAELVAAKSQKQYFEDFIADSRACRQTTMGFDGTVGQNYAKEFAAAKIFSARTGSNFSWGSDNIQVRIMKLQGVMNIRGDGTTRLRILGCPELCRQLERYKRGRDAHDQPTEEPAKYQKIDMAHCLEYFTSRNDCGYVKPPMSIPDDFKSQKTVVTALANMLGFKKSQTKDVSIYCGAGAPD